MHDQTCVKIVLHDMLNKVNLTNKKIIIERTIEALSIFL